ncbi:head GIN domain-containing protein [Aequorivita sp. SDUM287046]|uniref:Head GIN domain-containing protein n=1 Tax=Aequorivita aurantiaca TaxID=3053356 RepID=A0ABT8DGR8_9FLAO|nr:head GIN domain-containing protein [Aequorivita aurantiaca]MDN3724108.1 head GIN domain-containing protein [Aequorivita aurantiaca]
MKTKIYLLAASAAIVLSACHLNIKTGEKGNGKVVTQEREVTADFNEVRGSAGLDVYLTQGNENKIVVEADENLLQFIETDIENGKLHVTTSENIGKSKSKKVYVTFKELEAVEASSGADVTGNSVIKSQKLMLKSSSGGELEVEIFAQEVSARTSSGAELQVSGKATSLHADASSGSELDAKELLVLNCNAEASSGAQVTVNVQEKLETNASSGGEINYYGNPISVNSNKSHSGSVKKM